VFNDKLIIQISLIIQTNLFTHKVEQKLRYSRRAFKLLLALWIYDFGRICKQVDFARVIVSTILARPSTSARLSIVWSTYPTLARVPQLKSWSSHYI